MTGQLARNWPVASVSPGAYSDAAPIYTRLAYELPCVEFVGYYTLAATPLFLFFFFSSRRRHTRSDRDWSSDVCSSDLASRGARTGYSTGRVEWSPSTTRAAARETPKVTHRFHSGFQSSTARISMKVAKASLSQMPFHQLIVTRSPNHMWAFSCATTSATRSISAWDAARSST